MNRRVCSLMHCDRHVGVNVRRPTADTLISFYMWKNSDIWERLQETEICVEEGIENSVNSGNVSVFNFSLVVLFTKRKFKVGVGVT